MFTRTHQYRFPIPKEHLKYRLVGRQMRIHDIDLLLREEEDQDLCVVPTAEELKPKSKLPLTQVALKDEGNKTCIVIKSSMRPIDSGGTLLLLLFCVFFVAASFILFFVGKEPVVAITMCGISVTLFLLFIIWLQTGYFDYVRKISADMKHAGEEITTDVRRRLFKHKPK